MSRPYNLLVTSIVTVLAIFIGLQFQSPDSLLMRFITPYSASILPQARRAFAPIASTFSTFPPTMSSSTSNRDAENAVDGQPLGLPSPPSKEEEAAMKLDMSSGSDTIKLDHLGPLVVNKDGSLSRISNWEQMTAQEKKSTLKILGKRNQLRTDALKESEDTMV